MKLYSILLLAIVAVVLSSCLKDDVAVKVHQPGSAVTGNFFMGTNYKYQGYFDFESNTFISQNVKDIWDLGFDTRTGKFAVTLNYARFCRLANTGSTDFNAVTDTVGSNWVFDNTSGNLDSTAVGTWGIYTSDTAISANIVYVLDRGVDSENNRTGFVKFKLNGANNSFYSITFSNLDGSDLHTVLVERDNAYNFSFLSLNNGGATVSVEPPKDKWDIAFTQYTYLFYDPYTPYLVVGVLQNRGLTVANDSIKPFVDITLSDTLNYSFSSHVATIGYSWKQVFLDGANATYTVKPYKVYIIRNRNGIYYKLHFTDFYKDGVKGNTVFEFQAL